MKSERTEIAKSKIERERGSSFFYVVVVVLAWQNLRKEKKTVVLVVFESFYGLDCRIKVSCSILPSTIQLYSAVVLLFLLYLWNLESHSFFIIFFFSRLGSSPVSYLFCLIELKKIPDICVVVGQL